jgi:hypothetical protein
MSIGDDEVTEIPNDGVYIHGLFMQVLNFANDLYD